MKQKKIFSPGFISSLLLLFIIFYGCGDKETGIQERLRPVKTLRIVTQDSGLIRKFPGVVDAAHKAELSFRVSGKLAEILVKEGQFVKTGQVIARLNQTDFKIKLKDKQATYDKAKADFTRAEKLLAPGYISRSEYDSTKAALGSATAQLDAAKQDLNYTVLSAPFPGRIAKRHVENFEEVAAKQEIVFLQDISSFTVRIDVPENVIIQVRPGNKPNKVYAEFDSIKNKTFPLTLKEVATQADEATQTYAVTFTMPAIKEHNILPGMSVTVTVTVERHGGQTDHVKVQIYLPAHAVVEDQKGRFVYIVQPAESGVGVVRKKMVTTGQLTELGIEVKSGLDFGDQVVTAGMSQMTDGKRVRLLNGEKN